MKDTYTDNFNGGERGFSNDLSSVQTRHQKLTKEEIRFIGNLSCGKKVLSQNKTLFDCVITIYIKWLTDSNDGNSPAGINQKAFSSSKTKKTKGTFTNGTITRAIQFLESNKFLCKVSNSYQPGNKSKVYAIDTATTELLTEGNQDKLKKQFLDDKRRSKYEVCGINYDISRTCIRCNHEKHVNNFFLFVKDRSVSLTCGSCWRIDELDCRKLIGEHYRKESTVIEPVIALEPLTDDSTTQSTQEEPMQTEQSVSEKFKTEWDSSLPHEKEAILEYMISEMKDSALKTSLEKSKSPIDIRAKMLWSALSDDEKTLRYSDILEAREFVARMMKD